MSATFKDTHLPIFPMIMLLKSLRVLLVIKHDINHVTNVAT